MKVSRLAAFSVLSVVALHTSAVQAQSSDTIDVVAGSTVIDGRQSRDHVVRTEQIRVVHDSETSLGATTWAITTADSGGRRLRIVRGEGDSPRPDGSTIHASYSATLDQRSLAPRTFNVRQTSGLKTLGYTNITFDGGSIQGERSWAGNAQPIKLQLVAPPFMDGLADLVVEALPRRTGVVYRMPLWGPPAQTETTHLFQTTGRTDLTVLGITYRNAWVVTDQGVDGKEMSRMWLIDAPPYLIRWDIASPDGSILRLEQKLSDAKAR